MSGCSPEFIQQVSLAGPSFEKRETWGTQQSKDGKDSSHQFPESSRIVLDTANSNRELLVTFVSGVGNLPLSRSFLLVTLIRWDTCARWPQSWSVLFENATVNGARSEYLGI